MAPEHPPQLLPAPAAQDSGLHPAGPALQDLTPSPDSPPTACVPAQGHAAPARLEPTATPGAYATVTEETCCPAAVLCPTKRVSAPGHSDSPKPQ